MGKNISYILSRFFSSKTLLWGICVMLLFSLIPMQPAQAISAEEAADCMRLRLGLETICILAKLTNLSGAFANAIVNGVAASVDVVVGIVAIVVKGIVEVVASGMIKAINAFMDISVSPGNAKTPQAIREAWTTVRNLVNLVFILILTFIGLATILRLQTYQLQKTLPSLVIIALLVNFSGVLVGFIVDIGNIITKVFLNADTGFPGKWTWAGDAIVINGVASLGNHMVSLVYYTISLLVYFTVTFLFGIRTLILWTLAILSPIAFAAYILPATQKYWTQWLQQLIQWSILGIPISFTLYVSKMVLTPAKFAGDTLGFNGPIAGFFAPLTALFLLFIGITLSMQLAPAAAQKIIDVSKRSGRALGLWAGSNTWRTFGSKAEKLGANIRRRGQGIEVKADEQTRLEKFVGSTIGRVPGIGVLGKNPIARFGARMIGTGLEIGAGDINKRTSEKIRRVMGEGEKATQGKSYQEASTLMQRQLVNPGFKDWDRIVGYVNGIIKNEDSEDLMKDIESGRFSMDKMKKIYETSKMGGSPVRRPIEKALLSYALDEVDETTGRVITPNKLGVSQEHQKALLEEKMTGADIAKIVAPQNFDLTSDDPEVTKRSENLIKRVVVKGGQEVTSQLFKNGNLKQKQAIQKLFGGLGKQWFIDNHREDILLYMRSTAAEALALSPIEGAETLEQIRALVRIRDLQGPEAGEQEAKITRQLEEEEAKATQQLETHQKRRATLEQEYDAATNERARRPIRIQGRETDREIQRVTDQIQTIREDIRLRQAPIEDLDREAETLQEQVHQINAQPVAQINYAQREELNKQLQRVRQEINKKAPSRKTLEQQIQEDLTSLRTRLEQSVAQLNARTQELRNLIQQAQSPAGALDSAYQQQLPAWEAELSALPSQLADLDRQLQDVATGLIQIEGLKVPEAPVPLPKIGVDMPNQLQNLISNGKQTAEIIKEMTQRMQKSLQSIKDIQGDFDGVLQEMGERQSQITKLDREEQAGTLTPELGALRDDLRNKVQGLAQSRRELGEEMQRKTEAAIDTRETIEARKAELEDIRKQIEPLQEEYESKKKEESREKKIKQRQKKRS